MSRYEHIYRPGHPLAHPKNGQVLAHRLILFEKIGPGDHRCYLCDRPVAWGSPGNRGTLVVDHLNNDKLDNRADNLAPACHGCNIRKTHGWRVSDEETFVAHPDGYRMRGHRITCQFCGTEKIVKGASPRPGKNMYCSVACGNTAKARSRWGRGAPTFEAPRSAAT